MPFNFPFQTFLYLCWQFQNEWSRNMWSFAYVHIIYDHCAKPVNGIFVGWKEWVVYLKEYCHDLIVFFHKKCLYIFFFSFLSVLLYKGSFFRRERRDFISRDHVDSLVASRATLLVVLKIFTRTCHHMAIHPVWLPHTAKGALTSSCPAWRPVSVCFHLPVESCFFTIVLRNKCNLEVLCRRSKWFMPAMSLAGWVSQPSDFVGLC